MGIKKEIEAYRAFTAAVESYINAELVSGSKESLQLNKKAKAA